jgi:hypothetical protein
MSEYPFKCAILKVCGIKRAGRVQCLIPVPIPRTANSFILNTLETHQTCYGTFPIWSGSNFFVLNTLDFSRGEGGNRR